MTAYMCRLYQWEIATGNPGVKEREDFCQDFGRESVHRLDRVDGEP